MTRDEMIDVLGVRKDASREKIEDSFREYKDLYTLIKVPNEDEVYTMNELSKAYNKYIDTFEYHFNYYRICLECKDFNEYNDRFIQWKLKAKGTEETTVGERFALYRAWKTQKIVDFIMANKK